MRLSGSTLKTGSGVTGVSINGSRAIAAGRSIRIAYGFVEAQSATVPDFSSAWTDDRSDRKDIVRRHKRRGWDRAAAVWPDRWHWWRVRHCRNASLESSNFIVNISAQQLTTYIQHQVSVGTICMVSANLPAADGLYDKHSLLVNRRAAVRPSAPSADSPPSSVAGWSSDRYKRNVRDWKAETFGCRPGSHSGTSRWHKSYGDTSLGKSGLRDCRYVLRQMEVNPVWTYASSSEPWTGCSSSFTGLIGLPV